MPWLAEQLQKRRIRFKDVDGLMVVLVNDIETRGGTKFYKGERVKIDHSYRGKFHLSIPDEKRHIRHVRVLDVDVPEDEREEFLKAVAENKERNDA